MMKLETYIPLRYRKHFTKIVFKKGYFPPKYSIVDNTLVIPEKIAEHITRLLRLQGINISPEELIRGKYKVYTPYRDNKIIVFAITDEHGNMIGEAVKIPVKALEYYSSKPRLFIV